MLSELKKIAKNTGYEFEIGVPTLPKKVGNKILYGEEQNMWFSKNGLHYNLMDNYLEITTKEFFPEETFSLADYINLVSKKYRITVVLKISSEYNEVAGFNLLCNNCFRNLDPTANVIIDITHMNFCEKIQLDINNLPKNVKVSSVIDYKYSKGLTPKLEKSILNSNQSFESWAMNLSSEDFNRILLSLDEETKERIYDLRKIMFSFYASCPDKIKNGTIREKVNYAYRWCCQYIQYDISACKPDGNLKDDRRDSQDPYFTFYNKKGVCLGRARLLKIFLNNYYMKVPCFIVSGKSGHLKHAWNEILCEDGSIIDIDISNQSHRIANDHSELIAYQQIPDKQEPKVYYRNLQKENKE